MLDVSSTLTNLPIGTVAPIVCGLPNATFSPMSVKPVTSVQVTPSNDSPIIVSSSLYVITNTPCPYAIPLGVAVALGVLAATHVIPSILYAILLAPVSLASATNIPLPHTTSIHVLELGSVLAVHVSPVGDVCALVLPESSATNNPLPYVKQS